ncbi:MAG: cobalamin biosynthesis protein CobQ [Pseudomonadota bacterium]
MMTQTHLLVAAALFARPGSKRRNTAVIAGSLVPDLAIYVLFAFAILTGIPQSTLWNETYWSEPWQTYTAIGNSIPLYLAGLAASLVLVRPVDGRAVWQALPALFCLAALTHLAGDFPLHNDDAHEHFWPLSDWRFASPVSYWDRDHHGGIFSIFEGVLGLGLMVLLIRRFKARWVRAILFASIALYLLVPAFFLLSL